MPTHDGVPASWRTELLYTVLQRVFELVLLVQRSRFFAPGTQPDETRSYVVRPGLHACRIFRPAGQAKRSTDGKRATGSKLPLVILVHGGGFVVNTPSRDDPLARFLADCCGCLVVAIDYSKAPQARFPTAYEDVVAICDAVINDPELEVDKTKVVLCGNSAGGNLVLAAAQDQRLRGRLAGVTGLYPVVDFATTVAEKVRLAKRADPAKPDMLASSAGKMNRMYLGAQRVELEDVRLSPTFFKAREDLPENVYLIGVEYDLLCAEAERMAEKLAGSTRKVGRENGWQAGGMRWGVCEGADAWV